MNPNHVFAVFTHWVGLKLVQSKVTLHVAIEAVCSHMHILLSVVDQLFVVTKAPSKPMLLIAVTSILNQNLRQYYEVLKQLITKIILAGLVLDQGMQSKLFARLLFTTAQDVAVVLRQVIIMLTKSKLSLFLSCLRPSMVQRRIQRTRSYVILLEASISTSPTLSS
jgi:hypothetical protein